MTVNSTVSSAIYMGDGVSTVFPVPFYFLADSHLSVTLVNVDSKATSNAVLNTDYSVTGAGIQSGGSITMLTGAPAANIRVLIFRDIPIDQQVDYTPNDKFPAEVTEQALDKITMILQEIAARETSSIRYALSEYGTDGTLPIAPNRASTVLGFDANGTQTLLPIPASVGAGDLKNEAWTAGTDYTAGTSTSVTLSRAYTSKANLGTVVMAGVAQDPATYSLSGTTLTFLDGVGAPVAIPAYVNRIWCYGGTTISLSEPAVGTVSARLAEEAIPQLGTGHFYQSEGALIDRLNDRVFVGAAAVNGGNATSAEDYVSINIPQGPITAISQFAALSTRGSIGVLGGSRTSDAPNSGTEGSIGVMGVAVNDAVGVNKQVAFGGYFEAQQKSGSGFTAALECDTANQSGSVVAINPYSFFAGDPVVNIWAAAGGARSGVVNSSAAMAVLQNGASFDKGIVFEVGSLSSNEAIALASGHVIQWWGNAATPTGAVSSVQATGNMGVVLTDSGVALANVPGNVAIPGAINAVCTAAAVNGLNVVAAPSGFAPVIQAAGSDANIDLEFDTKGSGVMKFGTYTSGALSAAGYITIKDSTGTVRRLLVG